MDLCNIPLELKLMLTKCVRRFPSSTVNQPHFYSKSSYLRAEGAECECHKLKALKSEGNAYDRQAAKQAC